MTTPMLTLILGTLLIAVINGAFWHNQPARPASAQRRDRGFRLAGLLNRALEWLVLMPHVSNPAEEKEPVILSGKRVIPDRQTGLFRQVLRDVLASNAWRRILVGRAGTRPSIPTHLFKPQAKTHELAAEKTVMTPLEASMQ